MWTDPRRRLRVALLLLIPLVLTTLVLAYVVQFRGAISVDNRTYVEMATGVRAHGLPYTHNAYSEDFPEARPPFNIPQDGKLWGQYPPLYPYVAGLALHLGGLAALGKQSVLLVGLLGLVLFLVGWRYSGDPLRGVAAAYLTLLGSPAWASSVQTLSSPLLFLTVSLAVLAGLVSLDQRGWRTLAFSALAGFCVGLAVATHLLGLALGAGLLAALALARPADAPALTGVRGLVPDAEGWRRFGAAVFAFTLPLLPVAWLNHLRFGTYNPISYGPCVWAQCVYSASNDLSAAGLLRFALPAVPYFVLVGVALFLVRRRRWAIGLVLVVAALALVPTTAVGTSALGMLRTAYAYAFDNTVIDFGDVPGFSTFPDGLGHAAGSQVVKSFLQSSPILLCAALVPMGRRGARGRTLVLLLPVLGLVGNLAILARFHGAWSMGHPLVFLRYAIPAAPLLSVLAVEALWTLPWRRWHATLAVTVAVGGCVYFASTVYDVALFRRIVELRVTVLFAVLTVACVVLARRAPGRVWDALAGPLAAVTLGLTITVSTGVDTRMMAGWGKELDAQVGRLAALTPKRFAMVGYGPVSDHVLTLRAERDIAYIDLIEAPDLKWDNFRVLIDLWTADGRPIFGMFPTDIDPPFRWPYADWDVPGVQLDAAMGFWQIGPPGPSRRLTDEQILGLREKLRSAWQARKQRGERL